MLFLDLNKKTQNKILNIIKKHEWKILIKEYPYMLRLSKDFKYSLVKMNIYWNGKGVITKISTHMNHPKKGNGQIFRPVISIKDIEKYLINPRKHTNLGYGRTLNKKQCQ